MSGNRQKLKRNYMAADAHTDNFQGLTKVFDKSFFLKIQHKILHPEIQLNFFHPLGVALKNGPK